MFSSQQQQARCIRFQSLHEECANTEGWTNKVTEILLVVFEKKTFISWLHSEKRCSVDSVWKKYHHESLQLACVEGITFPVKSFYCHHKIYENKSALQVHYFVSHWQINISFIYLSFISRWPLLFYNNISIHWKP